MKSPFRTIGERKLSPAVHGSRSNEFPQLFDNMKYNNLQGTGGSQSAIWTPNVGMVQEVVVDIGAQIPDAVWATVPDDASINYKHYLYGAPKKQA